MNKSITSEQGLRKIQHFKDAANSDYLGESTIARALKMSIPTFRALVKTAKISGLPSGRNMLYKKGEVLNLRDKAKEALA